MNKKSNNKLSNFEKDLEKLQKLLDDIESDKLTLEQTLDKYKEGMELSKKCQEALEEAKQTIKVLENEK